VTDSATILAPDTSLRFGILGAAGIAPRALIHPIRHGAAPRTELRAVAARDHACAKEFAARYGIPCVHRDYQALLDDPGIDAVYIPLPNALHAGWTTRALEAGKHVLCEKPLASNAAEAEQVAHVAANSGRVLTEALHYRYHPLMERVREIIAAGEIGAIRSIDTRFCVPLLAGNDIRYRYDLAGGAAMDLGCYTIDFIRCMSGDEPVVQSARALLAGPEVDRYMEACFTLPAVGAEATMRCSLRSAALLSIRATIVGDSGQIQIRNPFLPHFGHRIRVQTPGGMRRIYVTKEPTYHFQLRAFTAAVRGESPNRTDAAGAISNLRVLDMVYAAAGLKRRGET
jgi:predicted dehydrogenase